MSHNNRFNKLPGDIDTVMVRLSGKKINEYIYEKRYVYSLEPEELITPKRIERSVSGNYWQELYSLHPGKYLVVEANINDSGTSFKYKRLIVFNMEDYLFEKRRLFPGDSLKPFKAVYQLGGFEISEWEEAIPVRLKLHYDLSEDEENSKKEEKKEEYKQPKEVEDKLSLLCKSEDDNVRKKVQYLIHKKDKCENMSKDKKENVVKVVYFKIGRMPEKGDMENTVEGAQKAVGGGYFQILRIGKSMAILCDEDGLIKGLPNNRGLKGDWLIVGTKGEEFVSLTDEQIEWVIQNVKHINARRRLHEKNVEPVILKI